MPRNPMKNSKTHTIVECDSCGHKWSRSDSRKDLSCSKRGCNNRLDPEYVTNAIIAKKRDLGLLKNEHPNVSSASAAQNSGPSGGSSSELQPSDQNYSRDVETSKIEAAIARSRKQSEKSDENQEEESEKKSKKGEKSRAREIAETTALATAGGKILEKLIDKAPDVFEKLAGKGMELINQQIIRTKEESRYLAEQRRLLGEQADDQELQQQQEVDTFQLIEDMQG